jgi:hypothetical protein
MGEKMITVYRVKNDVDYFQYFLTKKKEEYHRLIMDGTPKSKNWSPPLVYIYRPKHQKGDFYNTSSGSLISRPKATEILRPQFESAGELLPLPYRKEIYTILNVTTCIDCLDKEKTEWVHAKSTNTRLMIEKYAFHNDRFTSIIFKIPETCMSEVLVVEGLKDTKDEFRHIVEANRLLGLIFEKIWEN